MTWSLYDQRSTVSGAGVLSFGSGVGAGLGAGGGPTPRKIIEPSFENRGATSAESETTRPLRTPGVEEETSSAAGASPPFQR